MNIRERGKDYFGVTCWSIEAQSKDKEWFRFNVDSMPQEICNPLFAGYQVVGDHVALREKFALEIALELRNRRPEYSFRVRKIEIQMKSQTVATFERLKKNENSGTEL